jgi:hypothetical protein
MKSHICYDRRPRNFPSGNCAVCRGDSTDIDDDQSLDTTTVRDSGSVRTSVTGEADVLPAESDETTRN